MKFRKLRITWTVAWGVTAVLMCVLWVRSWEVQSSTANWYGDELKYKVPGQRYYKAFSNRGGVRLMTASYNAGWEMPVLEDDRAVLGFGILKGPTSLYVRIPHWFLISVAVLSAAAIWLPPIHYRFSLRTLLIATTLIAVGLGLIVWLG